MDANTGPKPSFLKRNGVRLAHFETGPANPRDAATRPGQWLDR